MTADPIARLVAELAKLPGIASLFGAPLQSGAPGVLKLDLGSGQWSTPPPALLAQLPPLPADAPMAQVKPGQAFALGQGLEPSAVGLWQIQLPQSPQLVWHSGLGPGPSLRAGTALAWDAGQSRVLLAQVDVGALKLWQWSVASQQWSVWHTQPVPSPLRCGIAGGGSDRLMWAVGAPGTSSLASRWSLAGPPIATDLGPSLDGWAGTVDGVWSPEQTRVVVGGRLHPDGSAHPGFDQWPWTCP